jgi:hypothetical protein
VKTFIKTVSVMAIVAGITLGLWAIAGPIIACDAHQVVPHAWLLFMMRAGLCAGLLTFGGNFYDFERHAAMPSNRFYSALGREERAQQREAGPGDALRLHL